MRGTILGVHEGRGIVTTSDARRLEFPLTEWRSPGAPGAGQQVDFAEEGGEARAVYAVPGGGGVGSASVGAMSGSFVLGATSVACLAIGFFIPFLPTVAALVIGIIGAQNARREEDETALLLSRIGWIGAVVLLVVGMLALMAIIVLFGGVFGLAALLNFDLGPMDF
ncbi:MAG: hypothetical protein AB7G05_12355 [Hyphomonadaceae bacterium]